MSDIIEKIAKVLNQAENASTEAEAEAFLKAAQALSTKYSIGLAEARAHTSKKEQRENPVRQTVDLTDFGRNTKKHLVSLFSSVANANDVRIDIAHDSTRVYPFGFPSDIELTRVLFAHLAMQMVEEANKFIASGEYKNETAPRLVTVKGDMFSRREWRDKPIDGRVARSNFYAAFISRISARLCEAKEEATAEIVAESSGTELVLADKQQEVYSYYKRTSNAKGSWGGPSSSGYSSSSRAAGTAAGSRARLSAQTAVGGAKGALTS